MIVLFDENMPRHLAEGFQILQKNEGLKAGYLIEVKHMPSVFHKGVKDKDWIIEAGLLNACVVTQDINIHRRKHELELYKKNGIGMFFLRGPNKKKGLSIWQMVEALAKNWEIIADIVYTEQRPFAYKFGLKGKIERL